MMMSRVPFNLKDMKLITIIHPSIASSHYEREINKKASGNVQKVVSNYKSTLIAVRPMKIFPLVIEKGINKNVRHDIFK